VPGQPGNFIFPLPGFSLRITASRRTAESEVTVKVDFGPRKADPKKGLQTTMPFLNHMLEHIIWRGEFNLEVAVKLKDFDLKHVICEDIGITFGRVLKEHVESRLDDGLRGYGSAISTIDEALAETIISFENRAYLDFNSQGVTLPFQTE
jgi:imidazoleglycerol-phosphate dehydratase